MQHSRLILAAGLTCVLVGCTSNNTSSTILPVGGARTALYWAEQLLRMAPPQRPSALLGVFTSPYLSLLRSTPQRSALTGIDVQMSLLFPTVSTGTDAFMVLQEFGSTLQTDVTDMLNRSVDRRAALDEYLAKLDDGLRKSEVQIATLTTERDAVTVQRRELRNELGDLQSTLNRALRDEDYGTAGRTQQQVIEVQPKLSEAETKEKQLTSTINILKDLQEVAVERKEVMNRNREVLIAGLKVIELPGIEDLNILEQGSRRRSFGL